MSTAAISQQALDGAKPTGPQPQRPKEERSAFRPDIEGLRAVAVLIVLGFHAAVPGMAGGYVGVDVFFVVSGYLITGQLLAALVANSANSAKTEPGKTFSLAEFYARRARRLLPAACVVLLATTLASWWILPPLREKDVAYDVLTAALNSGNWRFVADQTNYLAASRAPSPLLHYWSLGVEEQFYLVWAPLLLLIVVSARRLHRSPKLLIAAAIAVLTAASLALSIHWTHTSPPLAYMGSPSRAWQFGAGAALALVLSGDRTIRRTWLRATSGYLGIAAILASVVAFDAKTLYPGTAALLPTLGAVALLLAGAKPASQAEYSKAEISGLLATRPPRAIGRLSFCLYLWHWPILVLTEARFGDVSWPVAVLLVALSALPAMATARLVEQPLRFSKLVASAPRRGLAIGATAILLPLAAGLAVGSQATKTLGSVQAFDASTLPAGASSGANLFATVADHRSGGATKPSPVQARVDFPPDGACEVAPKAVTSPPCLFTPSGTADTGAPTANRIVLLGDSHAGQWFSTIRAIAAQNRWDVEELVKQGCPLPQLTVTNPELGREYRECDTWRANTLTRLANEPRPQAIVVATLNWYTADPSKLATAWDATLAKLTPIGAPIAYVRDTPKPDQDVPVCVSGAQRRWSDCAFAKSKAFSPDHVADQIAEGKRPGISVIDVNATLCPGTICPAVLDGVLLYRDDSHLTNAAATALAPRIAAQLPGAAGWKSVWREDFTGPSGSQPSRKDWVYDTGTCYPGCAAPQWGTGEIESMSDSTANVHLDGQGHLEITPILANGTWTSGRIETQRTDFQAPPGGVLRIEASIALPAVSASDGTGSGYWPAFWTLGSGIRDGSTTWPGGGEVDVMENVNGLDSVSGTLHCGSLPTGPCGEHTGLSSGEKPCTGCQGAFHTYAVEVDSSQQPEQVCWYLDGKEYFRVTSDKVGTATWQAALHHGMYAILDVAVGGTFPAVKGGGPGPATVSGKPMVVDYVAISAKH